MVDFILHEEELKEAPPEVRQWLSALLGVGLTSKAPKPEMQDPAPRLAACTLAEAAAVFEQIRSDHISTQVFFELGRDMPTPNLRPGPVHRIALSDIAQHVRLKNAEQLVSCLQSITRTFREVRQDPDAALFAFDQQDNLYVHEVTHSSIAYLWHQLVTGGTPQIQGRLEGEKPALGSLQAI